MTGESIGHQEKECENGPQWAPKRRLRIAEFMEESFIIGRGEGGYQKHLHIVIEDLKAALSGRIANHLRYVAEMV
jgi:hypothetical protein